MYPSNARFMFDGVEEAAKMGDTVSVLMDAPHQREQGFELHLFTARFRVVRSSFL